MTRAVIALGGNLGDREANLAAAVRAIDAIDGTTIVAASGRYETPALTLEGIDAELPAYLNAVVIVETPLEPAALLSILNAIEDAQGRTRETRWGSRTLDLDIVHVDGVSSRDPELVLPHPRAHERAFVLAPWLEADAEAELPGHGRVADLLAAVDDPVARVGALPGLGGDADAAADAGARRAADASAEAEGDADASSAPAVGAAGEVGAGASAPPTPVVGAPRA